MTKPDRTYVPGMAFGTVAEAEQYIEEHALNVVARQAGTVVGVDRVYLAGVGYRVYTEKVQPCTLNETGEKA